MERRFNLNFELRADEHQFSAYVARFYDPMDTGTEYEILPNLFERISPTAFKNITRDVVALVNHNADMPIARTSAGTLDIKTDSRGLKVGIPYDGDDPDHRKLKAKINNRSVQGCSFGFIVRADRFTEEKGRHVVYLDDVDLIEVSLGVTFPAYSGTSAKFRSEGESGAKYAEYLETIKRFEKFDQLTK